VGLAVDVGVAIALADLGHQPHQRRFVGDERGEGRLAAGHREHALECVRRPLLVRDAVVEQLREPGRVDVWCQAAHRALERSTRRHLVDDVDPVLMVNVLGIADHAQVLVRGGLLGLGFDGDRAGVGHGRPAAAREHEQARDPQHQPRVRPGRRYVWRVTAHLPVLLISKTSTGHGALRQRRDTTTAACCSTHPRPAWHAAPSPGRVEGLHDDAIAGR
jgi:hypothetical protein